MRFSFILATIFATVISVSAQYPNCAAICITKADTGGCTDNTCLCKSEAFVKSTGDCFIAQCSGDDQKTAFSIAQEMCREAGVTSTSDFGSATAQGSNTASATGASNTGTTTGTTAASQQTGSQQSSSNNNNAALSTRVNVLAGVVGVGAGFIALAL
ncbi:hypothetical protein L218DRAFT_382501 [Marasmius fiardii PR-910]|nr:hypothetical protein L218DRAFT_382501 [Marasmius fiardii PR-910]